MIDPWTGIDPTEPVRPAYLTLEDLITTFERIRAMRPQPSPPMLVEVHAQDKATLVHVFNEPRIEQRPSTFGTFLGVPVFFDQDERPGVVRLVYSDGSEKTVP